MQQNSILRKLNAFRMSVLLNRIAFATSFKWGDWNCFICVLRFALPITYELRNHKLQVAESWDL